MSLVGVQLNLGAWAGHLRAHPPACAEEAAAHGEALTQLWATLLAALAKLGVRASSVSLRARWVTLIGRWVVC